MLLKKIKTVLQTEDTEERNHIMKKKDDDMVYLEKEKEDMVSELLQPLVDVLKLSIEENTKPEEILHNMDYEIQQLSIKLRVIFSELSLNADTLESLRDDFSDKQMYILCMNLLSNKKTDE